MLELYCKLFVNATVRCDELLHHVLSIVGGELDGSSIVGTGFVIYVWRNDDDSPDAVRRDPGDFIYFPFTVEVEATAEHPLPAYLALVAKLMEGLHAHGAVVVAACDWEEQLPGAGKLGVQQPR